MVEISQSSSSGGGSPPGGDQYDVQTNDGMGGFYGDSGFMYQTGVVKISNLGGSGTKMVVTNNTGILSTQSIPTGTVQSVTGLNTDNADPTNPVVKISVDGSTVTGLGTPGSPLVSHSTPQTLTQNQIAFGSGSNLVTSSSDFEVDTGNRQMVVSGDFYSNDQVTSGSALMGNLSGYPGIWFGVGGITKTFNNYCFLFLGGNGVAIQSPDPAGNIDFRINNGNVMRASPGSFGSPGNIGIGTGSNAITARLEVDALNYNATALKLIGATDFGQYNDFLSVERPELGTPRVSSIDCNGVLMQKGNSRVSTQFDKTTDTTLANVTGLSTILGNPNDSNLPRTYQFEAVLFVSAGALGGTKFAINGTATVSSIIYNITLTDNTTNVNTITSEQTSLGGSAGQAGTTTGLCVIRGVVTVTGHGTLTVQFAQNVSNGTASSIKVGSYFLVQEII